MKNYIERRLLSDEDLFLIKSRITSCKWVDGCATAIGMSENKVKKNVEAIPSNSTRYIDKLIFDVLDKDEEFFIHTVPSRNTPSIISKMDKDCYYNIHQDSALNGDYSTTIFLSDPKEYDGGELCLFLNGEEVKFKLEAGHAVTYMTGTPHKVNKVKSGQRLCLVLWTYSSFKDPSMRLIYSNLLRIKKNMRGTIYANALNYDSFEDISSNSDFIVNETMSNMLRQYGT